MKRLLILIAGVSLFGFATLSSADETGTGTPDSQTTTTTTTSSTDTCSWLESFFGSCDE